MLGWKFLKKQDITFGNIFNENKGSSVSLGGVSVGKVGGANVDLGIRFRVDKGFGRGKDIIETIKDIQKKLEPNGIKMFLENYVKPDILANNDEVFENKGINLYGDGTFWPDNSRLWKLFKEKNLGQTVSNPFKKLNPEIQFIEVKYNTVGMLTGRMRDVLTNPNSKDKDKLKFHITGSNLYVGSPLSYLSAFQEDRPVLFIGEHQKQNWLEMFKEFATTDNKGEPRYNIAKKKNKLEFFQPVRNVSFLDKYREVKDKNKEEFIKKLKESKKLKEGKE